MSTRAPDSASPWRVSCWSCSRKISQSLPTPAEVLDQFASDCDALIHAVADLSPLHPLKKAVEEFLGA